MPYPGFAVAIIAIILLMAIGAGRQDVRDIVNKLRDARDNRRAKRETVRQVSIS